MANKKRRELVDNLKYNVLAQGVLQNAMKLLEHMPEGKEKANLRETLREYLLNNHYLCKVKPANPMKPEYKQIIRDDFNGDIYSVDKDYLSFQYRYALKNSGLEKYPYEQYVSAMDKNEAWNLIKSFGSYRAVEKHMLSKMFVQELPPHLIKAMEVNDFRDFVRNNCREEFKNYRCEHSFVKKFIAAHEEEFRNGLYNKGVPQKYVDALVESMKTQGKAWDVKVYDRQELRITGPEFDLHHIEPVSSPSDISCLSEVNNDDHLCLIEKKTHHYLHALEKMQMEESGMVFEKIKVPTQAACILDFENYILHDFNHPENMLHRKPPKKENIDFLNKINIIYLEYADKYLNKRHKGARKYMHLEIQEMMKNKNGIKR